MQSDLGSSACRRNCGHHCSTLSPPPQHARQHFKYIGKDWQQTWQVLESIPGYRHQESWPNEMEGSDGD